MVSMWENPGSVKGMCIQVGDSNGGDMEAKGVVPVGRLTSGERSWNFKNTYTHTLRCQSFPLSVTSSLSLSFPFIKFAKFVREC